MGRDGILVLYAIVMVASIVALDFLFFRHLFGQRLIANIAIVLVFIVIYSIFLRHK